MALSQYANSRIWRIERCDQYQKMKNRTEMLIGKLKPNIVPEKLWQHISVDFIMKLLVIIQF